MRGAVQAWRPALPRMRVRAGATVELATDEQTKLTFLHDVFSASAPTCRAGATTGCPSRHRALPRRQQLELRGLRDLRDRRRRRAATTQEPLPIDTELTVEVVPPGAAAPIAIAGRVSYHVPSGGSGLRFVSRDGDGDRRLRELIRRLRAS